MDMNLKGCIALITGGARGIGIAEAEALAAEGVSIALNDIDKDAANLAVEKLKKIGVDAECFVGDAADEDSVKENIKKISQRFGRLDILVNNAGIGVRPSYAAADMPVGAWDLMQHVHVRSTFLWSRGAIPLMRRSGFGRIINTSSMNYTGGGRVGASHYVAAKAAIAGFTRVLAKEVGPSGITVNAIAPGYVSTELIADFSDEMMDIVRNQNPTQRLCSPEEIGKLVAFLSSRHAGFINGEIICIDGGRREYYWGNDA